MRFPAVLAICSTPCLALAAAQPIDFPAELRENLRQRVASGECPGIIVGIAGPAGQSFMSEGHASLAADAKPIRDDTVFEIGSITKTFTALLYQMAVDGRILNPEATIAAFLPPDLKLAEPVADITLQQLVTHRSGLPRMPDNFRPASAANPYADYTRGQLYAWLQRVALVNDGSFLYSNAGMGLLGHVIERKTGTNYESLLRSWITTPLGLVDTGITLGDSQKKRIATPHSDGRPIPMWDIPTLAGAGAIRSTARDLLRWSATQGWLIDSPLSAAMKRTQRPQAPTERRGGQIALAWLVSPAAKGTIVWHNGGTGGTRSWAGFNSALNIAVIVLTNSSIPADDIGFRLLGADMPLRTPRFVAAVPQRALENCAGAYDFGKEHLVVRVESQRLRVRMADQPAFPAYPKNEREFFLRAIDAALTFEFGADGKATAVILHQNGRDQRATRIADQ